VEPPGQDVGIKDEIAPAAERCAKSIFNPGVFRKGLPYFYAFDSL
jgi:hypothetical protein